MKKIILVPIKHQFLPCVKFYGGIKKLEGAQDILVHFHFFNVIFFWKFTIFFIQLIQNSDKRKATLKFLIRSTN